MISSLKLVLLRSTYTSATAARASAVMRAACSCSTKPDSGSADLAKCHCKTDLVKGVLSCCSWIRLCLWSWAKNPIQTDKWQCSDQCDCSSKFGALACSHAHAHNALTCVALFSLEFEPILNLLFVHVRRLVNGKLSAAQPAIQ